MYWEYIRDCNVPVDGVSLCFNVLLNVICYFKSLMIINLMNINNTIPNIMYHQTSLICTVLNLITILTPIQRIDMSFLVFILL